MKFRNLLFVLVLVTGNLIVKAQIINNLVIFSNEGQPFTLIINGLKENQTPATNVRVQGLDLKAYAVKVIYENKKLKDANTTITFFRTGKECVFGLIKKGKKKHTIDYVSEKEIDGFLDPIQQAPANTNTQPQTQNLATVPTQTLATPPPTFSPFEIGRNAIVAQPSDEGKLTAALALLQNSTLSVTQIKQILPLFSNETTKLLFAKQACAQLKDPMACTEIIGTFIAAPLKQELQNFLQGKK